MCIWLRSACFQAVDNEIEVQLLMSRDGLRWRRTGKRQPFLAPRGEGLLGRLHGFDGESANRGGG